MGSPNETIAAVNGISCLTLVDTGSMVSTVSEVFWRQKLSDVQLKPIGDLLHIEGAAGQAVPYLGYIEVSVNIPEISQEQDCLILVVPQTNYSSRVPLLIGTNILKIITFLRSSKKN